MKIIKTKQNNVNTSPDVASEISENVSQGGPREQGDHKRHNLCSGKQKKIQKSHIFTTEVCIAIPGTTLIQNSQTVLSLAWRSYKNDVRCWQIYLCLLVKILSGLVLWHGMYSWSSEILTTTTILFSWLKFMGLFLFPHWDSGYLLYSSWLRQPSVTTSLPWKALPWTKI